MKSKPLHEQVPYRKQVWIFGFVKTTLSGAFISTGVVLLLNGLTAHLTFKGYNEVEMFLGIISITLAVIIVYSIDKWKETKKKEELDIIDKRAAEIAEEKILEALEELEKK